MESLGLVWVSVKKSSYQTKHHPRPLHISQGFAEALQASFRGW